MNSHPVPLKSFDKLHPLTSKLSIIFASTFLKPYCQTVKNKVLKNLSYYLSMTLKEIEIKNPQKSTSGVSNTRFGSHVACDNQVQFHQR